MVTVNKLKQREPNPVETRTVHVVKLTVESETWIKDKDGNWEYVGSGSTDDEAVYVAGVFTDSTIAASVANELTEEFPDLSPEDQELTNWYVEL